MAIETGLEGKPWYVAAGVALGLLIVIVWASYFVKLKSMGEQIVRQENHLSELQAKINEGRSAQRSLPQFRETVQRLELDLEKLLRILPPKRNSGDLLRRIRALTEQGDFNLLRFRPGTPTPNDFYSTWSIQISLHGTYHNLALFFDRISHFSRIINIEDLRIDALRVGHHTIASQFTAKTFLYNEPEDLTAGGDV